MKTQVEVNAKIEELEIKLTKEFEHSTAWWSIYNKIIALRWVVE